jgi:hypothetical protein
MKIQRTHSTIHLHYKTRVVPALDREPIFFLALVAPAESNLFHPSPYTQASQTSPTALIHPSSEFFGYAPPPLFVNSARPSRKSHIV